VAISDPTRKLGASVADLEAHEYAALDLMARPTLNIPVPLTAAPRVLVGGVGILAGAYFRRSDATSGGVTYLGASSANAAAANNVTLPAGGAGTVVYVTGFEITGDGATAGSIITVTLTGVIGGTKTYFLTIPAGVGVDIGRLFVTFPYPGLPANAANTAITLNVPSFGAGNTNAAVNIEGYLAPLGTPSPQTGVVAVSQVDLLDGTDAGGEALASFTMPPQGGFSMGAGAHGPVFTRGLFLNVVSGNLQGAVHVKI